MQMHLDPDFTGFEILKVNAVWSLTPEQWWVVTKLVARELHRRDVQAGVHKLAGLNAQEQQSKVRGVVLTLYNDKCRVFSHVQWGKRYPWPWLACFVEWCMNQPDPVYAAQSAGAGGAWDSCSKWWLQFFTSPPYLTALYDPMYSSGLAIANGNVDMWEPYSPITRELWDADIDHVWLEMGFTDVWHGMPTPHTLTSQAERPVTPEDVAVPPAGQPPPGTTVPTGSKAGAGTVALVVGVVAAAAYAVWRFVWRA